MPWIQPTKATYFSFSLELSSHPLNYLFFNFCFMVMVMCMKAHVRHEWPPALFRLNVSIWRLGPTYLAFSESAPHFYLFIRFLFATVSWVRSPSFYLNQMLPRVRPIFALVDHPTRHVCCPNRRALFSCWARAGSFGVENCEFWYWK